MKKLLQILEEREYSFNKEIEDIKTQLEEAKRTEEEIGTHLKEHISICEKLNTEVILAKEDELASLRCELEKSDN